MSLRLLDIHKRFGPVRANDGVTLEVEAGTIHGLLGENGAGKSTLMKVLSGFIRADAGTVELAGTTLDLASPRDAVAAGIGMLHQDPLVFLPFSVVDNFVLAARDGGAAGGGRRWWRRRRMLDRGEAARVLDETSRRFGFSFDPDAPARALTVGERQQLEMTRLLWLGARVLILDEPTTGISASQRDVLFGTLRALADEGMIVIFVSHKLEEVEELCGRVTVMRRGKVVGETAMPYPTEGLVEMMFGEVLVEGERAAVDLGAGRLRLGAVRLPGQPAGSPDLSLEVRAGEVVGLAGLEGSGQRRLLQVCAGVEEPSAGSVAVDGEDLTGRGYRAFLGAGVHYLPAGRLEEGLVAGLTVAEHVVLCGGDRSFFVDASAARAGAERRIAEYSISGTPDSVAEALSGGNQQRLLLSLMPPSLRVLLMEHPTRGLDVGSAEWVWKLLLERRSGGTAMVFASADLDELLRYSDRILVFFAGGVLRVLDTATTGSDELAHLIGGKVRS